MLNNWSLIRRGGRRRFFRAREREGKKRARKHEGKKARKKRKRRARKKKARIRAFYATHSGIPVLEPKVTRQGRKQGS